MTAPARMQRRPLVQETSRAAFRQRPLGAVDAQILAVVERMGGACDHEIEAATALRHQTVSANRRHLVERGELRASDERRATLSGRKAIVWVRCAPSTVAPTFPVVRGPRGQMSFGEVLE